MIVILLILLSGISTLEYSVQCPHQSQRRLRAMIYCNGTQLSWYSCLYDVQSRMYVEDCSLKPDFVKRGEKYIISGRRANEPCSEDRYQPFKFWPNASTKCILKKSSCNEVGQMVYEHGTSESDVACRCDHSKNYARLSNTSDMCYCLPTVEDCTCHLKQCPEGEHLSSDYRCRKKASPDETNCKLFDTNSRDLNYTIKLQSTSLTVHERDTVYIVTAFVIVLCISVVLIILGSCIFISGQYLCITCLHIKHEEHIKSDVIDLFSIYIPGHWRELKAILCSDSILKDLLELNIINIQEFDEVNDQGPNNRNKYILTMFTTKYMEVRSGKLNGDVFRNLLEKQQKEVRDILSKNIVTPRWPKRDPEVCKSRLQTAKDLIVEIELQGIMEKFLECLIFSANDYTKITKSPLHDHEKSRCFLESLISRLEKGSFECLLRYLKQNSDPALENLTDNLIPAIYIKQESHPDYGIADADICKNISSAILKIHIPENNDFNVIIIKHIRRYSPWFIYEFGMYPTEASVEEKNTCNAIIFLESVCTDALDRIKRSFELEGLAELLERLLCIEKVIETFQNEEEKVHVEMCLICDENIKKDHTIEDIQANMDEVAILRTNRSYLINEMEMAIVIEKFKRYPEIQKIAKQKVERKIINAEIVDTIIHNPKEYLTIFKRTIEENKTFCSICKRLNESRYVYRKTIATATLRNNIISNIIHLRDLPLDHDDLQNKFANGNIFQSKKLNSLKRDSDVFNSFIIEILKSDREAMLTFVDYLFQMGDTGMAETLLIERSNKLNLGCQGKTCHSSMKFGQKQRNIVLKGNFYIHKVKDVLCIEELD